MGRLSKADRDDYDALVGQLSDADVARLFGVSRQAVFERRTKLGRPMVRGLCPDLPRAELAEAARAAALRGGVVAQDLSRFAHMIGKAPDVEVAKTAGVGRDIIARWRKEHGIPAYRAPAKIDAVIDRMGAVSDVQLATEAGVTYQTVQDARARRGIPAATGYSGKHGPQGNLKRLLDLGERVTCAQAKDLLGITGPMQLVSASHRGHFVRVEPGVYQRTP